MFRPPLIFGLGLKQFFQKLYYTVHYHVAALLTNKNRMKNIFVYLKNKLLQRKLKASEWFCEEKKRLMTFHWIQIICAESSFFLIFLG
jgi:hypothetical protein